MKRNVAFLILAGLSLILFSTFSPQAATAPLAQITYSFTPTAFAYLPAAFKNYQPPPTATPTATATATATPTTPPTATPTLPPPSFDNCQGNPDPGSAGNHPVRIVIVYKTANPEVVRLQNVGASTVNLTDWHMCSIDGNQEHTGISGTLAAGQTKDFTYTGGGFIWDNVNRDDGALYNSSGQLVSYWID